jgi:hypothetical protein
MIKKIAQVINEANLVLNEDFVPDHDDYEIQPQAPGGVWAPDLDYDYDEGLGYDYDEGVATPTIFPFDILLSLFAPAKAIKVAKAMSLTKPAFGSAGRYSQFSPGNWPVIGWRNKTHLSRWDPRRWGAAVARGALQPHASSSYTPGILKGVIKPINSVLFNFPPGVVPAVVLKYFIDNPELLTTEMDEAISDQFGQGEVYGPVVPPDYDMSMVEERQRVCKQ